jgi:hypothetical protein
MSLLQHSLVDDKSHPQRGGVLRLFRLRGVLDEIETFEGSNIPVQAGEVGVAQDLQGPEEVGGIVSVAIDYDGVGLFDADTG